jgi:prepilin peptidase CpaA
MLSVLPWTNHHLIKYLELFIPLLLSILMAIEDAMKRRISNYLTLLCLSSGLAFQIGINGWSGLLNSLLGIGLGFLLLIFFYIKGGMGAGDVKALASLGSWLGPQKVLYFFIYMSFSGVLLIFILLWWRGLLWERLRNIWSHITNWIFIRFYELKPFSGESPPSAKIKDIPYGVALAMGMAILCWLEVRS